MENEDDYSGNYIVQNENANLQILKENDEYSHLRTTCPVKTIVDAKRAQEIKDYFLTTDIPPEWLDSTKSNWERSVAVATWIANNIKHANPDPWPEHKNCIDLYKWNLEHKTGFNCRCHAIMLNELLLTAGIENTFITCMPKDVNDSECHVVNLIHIPETNNWAMLDCDETEYIIDSNGNLLSLQQMREYLSHDKPFTINALPGFTVNQAYLKSYWTKNLYRFHCHTLNTFNVEDTADGKFLPEDKLLHLYPKKALLDECGEEYFERDIEIFTSNENEFWRTYEI